MSEWSANNQDRANQVWGRLAGCFGESLIRKFGEEPPSEWIGAISRLNDYQLQQGIRRVVYSGKAAAPSLPEFVKLCRTVGQADDVPDDPQATKPQMLEYTGGNFDKWDIAGNRHLFAYVLRKLDKKRCFDERETKILVRFKNLWADQMRLSAGDETVPVEEQVEVWEECIKRAETEMLS